ncbi:N-acetyltransferase [Pontibacillus halophilus JSM 076056 = DSM 19796]|uniref:N-acetyltransferase n=1 Tax=Pontibacillus halophilus JSM 076056 = DSM 19796 TaxID=1385510 RepID=A0A0A5I5H1_9BACI|nr:GNAT family N-acetyltransferase [Pontibacillus halophilus]KGX91067.1 N-acetyltransferase [Pontibacillus halophilus JSM 076056 = DSM 19796]
MKIKQGGLKIEAVKALLQEHLQQMAFVSPMESRHAFDSSRLAGEDVTFWTMWEGEKLLGCGALKELSPVHGEIKSMKTASRVLKSGVGRRMLEHILTEADARGYERVSLETGAQDYFIPARNLYEQYGFQYCPPFTPYKDDPNSLFMTLVKKGG